MLFSRACGPLGCKSISKLSAALPALVGFLPALHRPPRASFPHIAIKMKTPFREFSGTSAASPCFAEITFILIRSGWLLPHAYRAEKSRSGNIDLSVRRIPPTPHPPPCNSKSFQIVRSLLLSFRTASNSSGTLAARS